MNNTLVLTPTTAGKYLKKLNTVFCNPEEELAIEVDDYTVSWWKRPLKKTLWIVTRSQAFRLHQFIQHEHAKGIKGSLKVSKNTLAYLPAIYPYKEANGK